MDITEFSKLIEDAARRQAENAILPEEKCDAGGCENGKITLFTSVKDCPACRGTGWKDWR